MSPAGEWFREWFGEAYLTLYPHRNEDEAAAAVSLLVRAGRPERGGLLLDLACGEGRHLRAMERCGFRPVGFDLSAPLLARARERGTGGAPLVRGDMRWLPFGDEVFAALTNFFTSFGYFDGPDQDRDVAAEMARVLRPGGVFFLDYLNAARVRETLVPEDETVVAGRSIRQQRWLEDGTVVKRIEIRHGTKPPEVFHERVRLYEPGELEELLGSQGLIVQQRFGDYEGRPYDREADRLILCGIRS